MLELKEHKIYEMLKTTYNGIPLDYVILLADEEYRGVETHKKAVIEAFRIFNTRTVVGNNYNLKVTVEEEKMSATLCSMDAISCSYDAWYPDVESVYEDWNDEIDEQGWIDLDDPLPDCQHDSFLPIPVKGRNKGKTQWGQLEILKDGQWVDYK